jgi:hypothetical protein
MTSEYTSMMLRLSKKEEEALTKKCNEINKVLVNNDHPPYQKSELLHAIMIDVIKRTKINKRYEIEVE